MIDDPLSEISETSTVPAELPETLSALVRQYPAAVFAGGLAVGLLAGALLPKRGSGLLGQRALALAAAAGELGLAALDRTQDAGAKPVRA